MVWVLTHPFFCRDDTITTHPKRSFCAYTFWAKSPVFRPSEKLITLIIWQTDYNPIEDKNQGQEIAMNVKISIDQGAALQTPVMQACEQSNGYWCSDNAQPYVQRPPPLGIQIQVLKHTNTNTYKSQVQINTDVVIKSSHLSNLHFPLWMHGRPMFKNHPWEIVNKILSLNHFFTFCMLQNQHSKN